MKSILLLFILLSKKQENTGKYLSQGLLFNKVATVLIEEPSTWLFSFQFCEIFKRTYFAEHPRTVSIFDELLKYVPGEQISKSQ